MGTFAYQKIKKISPLYLATILIFLGIIAYTNSLGNALFYDDEHFIYNNIYVKNFDIKNIFTQSATSGGRAISNYYRPVLTTIFALEYLLTKNNGFLYHLDNILIHILVTIFLFVFLKKLIKNNFIAFLASALFIVHPIHTETVAYVTGRADPLAFLFMLLSLIFYLKKTWKYIFFANIFFVLAVLSKEVAIVTPILFVLVDFLNVQSTKKIFQKMQFVIPSVIIATTYILLRLTILNFQNTLNFYFPQNIYSSNLLVRIITFISVLPTYVSIVFFPKTLMYDRPGQVVFSPLNFSVIGTILVLLMLLFLSVKLFKKHPLFLFSLLWFFITIAPTSGIIPINGILYEHFLYIPSVGVFVTLTYLSYLALEKMRSNIFTSFLLAGWIIAISLLTFRTIMRNMDWQNPIRFYESSLSQNPQNARMHNNLAMSYAEDNNNQKAITEYQKAITISDVYFQTHFNLGNSYVAIGKFDEAEKEYKKAAVMAPSFFQASINLGRLYKQRGQSEKFEKLLQEIKLLSQKDANYAILLGYLESL